MSFYRNNNQVCYVGDNIPGSRLIAEAANPEIADYFVNDLNQKHADAEIDNGKLRIVEP